GGERRVKFAAVQNDLNQARDQAKSLTLTPNAAAKFGLSLNRDGQRRSAYDLLSYPEIDLARLVQIWPELGNLDGKTAERLETEARYAVYLDRQQSDLAVLRREQERLIPDDLDFGSLPGLSNELQQKLMSRRPRSLADAQRIDGMTPAALAILVSALQHHAREKGAA